MLLQLIHNVTLLITTVALYSLTTRFRHKHEKWGKALAGVLFGGVAVIGMTLPYNYAPGIIFDGRSIVLSLAGLFGGGTSIHHRHSSSQAPIAVSSGGAGVWAGLATIAVCPVVGLIFRRAYANRPHELPILRLLLLGFIAHLAMLACQLLLPMPEGLAAIGRIWFPILLIMPAATMVMGKLLANAEQRIIADKNTPFSKKKPRASTWRACRRPSVWPGSATGSGISLLIG